MKMQPVIYYKQKGFFMKEDLNQGRSFYEKLLSNFLHKTLVKSERSWI